MHRLACQSSAAATCLPAQPAEPCRYCRPDRGTVGGHALSARHELDAELYLQGDKAAPGSPGLRLGGTIRHPLRSLNLQGPLQSRGEGFLLTGKDARYSTESGQLDINTATFLLHESEMRGEASSLSRIGENQVLINDGPLTTCGPGRTIGPSLPRISSWTRLKALAPPACALEVLDAPVFYWPTSVSPLMTAARPVFCLAVRFVHAGSGAFLALPYYLNLAPHYDATLTPQFSWPGPVYRTGRPGLSRFGSGAAAGLHHDDSYYKDENPGADGQAPDLSTRQPSVVAGVVTVISRRCLTKTT